MTLGTAMIVALLGLASLTLVRIERMQVSGFSDSTAAERYARAAIDMALFEIRHNAAWRQDMTDGVWEADRPIGAGSYSFRAIDPADKDLTSGDYDPLVVIGTGKSGAAVYKLQVRIGVRQPGLRCLEPAIHAGNKLMFDAAIAQSDHFFSANNEAEVRGGAEVFADVEAANGFQSGSSGGGVFHGSVTTEGDWPREMPDPNTVSDYYLNNGTPISIYDLPLWDANLLQNPGMEGSSSMVPWYEVGSTISRNNVSNVDQWSLRVSNRSSAAHTVAQDVTSQLQSGLSYHSEAWVRSEGIGGDFRIALKLVSTGDGERIVPLTAWVTVDDSWNEVSGDAVVSWSGSLQQAEWFIETNNTSDIFRIDDVVLQEANAPSGWHVFHRKVLSPASNPFGSGITNPQGIYVLDCDGGKLNIRDSRIVGTLVFVNQNATIVDQGSINWSPALIGSDPSVPNMPALLAEESIELYFEAADLDEGQLNVNLNPPGTPYKGETDTDKADVFPSLIQGVVYSIINVEIMNGPRFDGVIVSGNDIVSTDADLQVTYDPVYFKRNAPPGFQVDPEFYIVKGSFKQVVD